MTRKQVSEKEIVVSAPVSTRHKKATAKRVKRTAPAAEAAAPVTQPITETPSREQQIAALAYSYWEARGYQGGSSEEDWLRAEFELRSNLASSATN